MSPTLRYVGLDVHAETIAAAVADADGTLHELGTIANRPEAVRKLLAKLGRPDTLRVCYEAGPTGYALYWQCAGLGIACAVIAPSLIPTKAGDRVKTDRRDAGRLARCHRAGDLTPVWVPDAATADRFIEDKLGQGDFAPVLDIETTEGQSAATIIDGMKQWLGHVEAATGRQQLVP